ncbi:MAG: furA 1 [Jatrophihabitantaceae bacterium]|nr:furA 1 [Jatrophihabitantaceae bacterium]
MTTAPEQLRGAGLRVTEPRLAIHAALLAHPHSTAAALIDYIAVDASAAGISKQGVYNVLDDLAAAGMVRRIEPAGSAARFELRVGDNHHHLVCRICGRTEDVDCAVGEAPCLVPVSNSGFVLDEAEVVWWGRCADCAAVTSTLSTSRSATPVEPIDSSNGTTAPTQEARV